MPTNRLYRIIWRLKEKYPNRNEFIQTELTDAIFYECGYDKRTIESNIKALLKLGLLKRIRRYLYSVEEEPYSKARTTEGQASEDFPIPAHPKAEDDTDGAYSPEKVSLVSEPKEDNRSEEEKEIDLMTRPQ